MSSERAYLLKLIKAVSGFHFWVLMVHLWFQLCQFFPYAGWIRCLCQSVHSSVVLISDAGYFDDSPSSSRVPVNIILHSFCAAAVDKMAAPPSPRYNVRLPDKELISAWQWLPFCFVCLIQRFCHCLLHKLLHQHVCRLCHLLHCGIHGQHHKKTHRRCGSLR